MIARRLRTAALVAAAVLLAALVAACGARSSGDDGDDKSVTLAVGAGWADSIAITHLWKYALEQEGYNVEVKELDIAPIFIGVAEGDIDMYLDVWLPATHEDYWEQYSDRVVDLGVWFDQATNNIAVPEYVDAQSIDDLKGMADELDGAVTGIDPGAGLTRMTKSAIKDYGLDDFELKTSSSVAMLAALKKATENKEPIVVTLWHPHWAYSAFPIKDLKDPKGSLGEAEEIHTMANPDFAESNPEIADAVKEFEMSDKLFSDLMEVVAEEHSDNPEAGAEQWAKDHKKFVDSLMN